MQTYPEERLRFGVAILHWFSLVVDENRRCTLAAMTIIYETTVLSIAVVMEQ